MRLDDYRESDNVGDQRGQNFGGGGGGFGGGGGGLGLLFALVGSRFGLGGIAVLVIGAMLFGINPFGGGSNMVSPQQRTEIGHDAAAKACNVDQASTFSCRVLASTEDTWGRIFAAGGQRYVPPGLIFYSGSGVSGCGAAQSAMGPFYCPTDNRVYLDTSFFDELNTRFHAGGDFAQAYVIAHEVGHHVQFLRGIAATVRRQQEAGDEAHANALQVRMELQADCYAGVWANNNRERLQITDADLANGVRAANAIGDDTLQKSAGRVPVPDSFTHGTSAERVAWLKRGWASGDPAQCDTFAGSID